VPPETLGAALIGALPEIARFLAAHARFQALSEEALARLAAAIEVEFHGRGATIPNRDDHGDALVRLVRSGSVDIVEQGRVVDQLGAGEALPDELAPTATAVAAEDVLSYRLPASLAQALLKAAGEPGTAPAAPTARSTAELSAAALARSPALVCGPEATIREVTGRMAEAGVGAALVQLSGSGGLGIVTDADLRSRVLASGLPPTPRCVWQ
jgi:CBS domain-containing protein